MKFTTIVTRDDDTSGQEQSFARHTKSGVEIDGSLEVDSNGNLIANLGPVAAIYAASDRRTKADGKLGAEGLKVKFAPTSFPVKTSTLVSGIPAGIKAQLVKVMGVTMGDDDEVEWENTVEFRFGGWSGCWLSVDTLANKPLSHKAAS